MNVQEKRNFNILPHLPHVVSTHTFTSYNFNTSNLFLWCSIARMERYRHMKKSIHQCIRCKVCNGCKYSYANMNFFHSHFGNAIMDIEKIKDIILTHCDVFNVKITKPISDYTNWEMQNVFEKIYSNYIEMLQNGIQVDPEQHPDLLKEVHERYGNVKITKMCFNVDV